MKRFFTVLLLIVLFAAVCFAAEPVYKYVESEPLSKGAELFRVREFYPDYNMSYSYIKMDLTDDSIALKLLKSDDGADVLERVDDLAKTDENTIAALNADFFSTFKGKQGFSLGIEKIDGVIKESPINPSTMATVAYDGRNVLMSYLDFHVMAVAPNWEYKEIRHINKHTSYFGDILMYTHEFNGGYSPAPGGDVLEVVVEDGKIAEFRRNAEPCKIPENGCVLVVSEGSTMFFANNFNVGDEIRFDYYITPSLDDFYLAFGGGSMLVYEGKDWGKISDYTHTVAGFHPRSAVGIDKEGETLILLAVDGRQESSRGMRMSHLAELLIDLGCYTAVNLDGGGSTNMVASTMWKGAFHSVNSPTENRRVINALGIVLRDEEEISHDENVESEEYETSEKNEITEENNEPEKAEEENKRDIAGIKIRAEKSHVLAGQPVKLNVAVHDSNLRPIEFEEDEIKWYVSDGRVEDNVFVSDVGGKITVGVSIEDKYGDTEIYVVDSISGIIIRNYIYMEKGDTAGIDFDVFDYSGRFLEINDHTDFEIVSSNEEVVKVENSVIYAVGNGNAAVSVSKDGVTGYMSVAVGSFPVQYKNDFEKNVGTFSSFPRETKGDFELSDEYRLSGELSGKLSFDFTEEEQTEPAVQMQADSGIVINENDDDVIRSVSVTFDDGIAVDENCEEIFLDVFTVNDFNHRLFLLLTDSDENEIGIEFTGNIEKNKWNELCFEIPDDAKRPLSLSGVYVLYTPGEEKDDGSIYLDNLALTSCRPYETVREKDNVYRYSVNNNNVKSSVTFAAVSDEYTESIVSRYSRYKLEYEMQTLSGYVLSENMKKGVSEDENAVYISLNTSGGGIRNTDSSQWNLISETVKQTQKDNIFILTSDEIFGHDEFENSVISDYLSSINKNVFVVSPSDAVTYKNISGVRYFTLDMTPETDMSPSRIAKKNKIEFYFGDSVTFKFK